MDFIQSVSDFIPFGVTVIIAVIFTSIIINNIRKIEAFGKYFAYLGKSLEIILLPGTVAHEFGHFICCLITRTPVRKVKFFTLGDPEAPGAVGYVDHEKVESFLSDFLIAFGPTISNGLLVALILYYLPNLHEVIKYYLIFALTLQAAPSNPDLKSIFRTFNANIKRSLFELGSMFFAVIPAWVVGSWNAYLVYEINWCYFMAVYFSTILMLIGCYKTATIRNEG